MDRKEYMKRWRKNNRLAVREYRRRWRENNRDHVREYDRAWRCQNRLKVAKAQSKYWKRVADEELQREKMN